MAAIKDIATSSDKWARRAAVAGPDYTAGVQNPRRPWAAAAAGAQDIWRTAVTEAATQGRYANGVRSTGDAGWQNAAVSKGPQRFAEGVQLATDKWQTGFSPYQQVISSLNLPPRGPSGSPQNLQRVTAVTQALRQKKLSIGSQR